MIMILLMCSFLFGINIQLNLCWNTVSILLPWKLLHGLPIFMDFLHLGEELQTDVYVSGTQQLTLTWAAWTLEVRWTICCLEYFFMLTPHSTHACIRDALPFNQIWLQWKSFRSNMLKLDSCFVAFFTCLMSIYYSNQMRQTKFLNVTFLLSIIC